jgi:hypothetical protein
MAPSKKSPQATIRLAVVRSGLSGVKAMMSSRRKKLFLVAGVTGVIVLAVIVFYRPLVLRGMSNGVFCGMEGTVTNVSGTAEDIHLQFNGRFWFAQYHGPRLAQHSVIEADCKRGLSATLTPSSFFVAMTPDGGGGAVRNDKGALLGILKAAAERGRVVKFELTNPVIAFDSHGGITNVESAVVRATDYDLH